MLRDEANLSTARHVLEDARHDCVAREEQLREQRPKFSFLASKKQRDEFAAATGVLQDQMSLIERMLTRVAAARERIQGPLRANLLDHMERSDPLYRQGLRAARFHEHWRRGLSLVADRLQGFLRELRASRNALQADVDQGRPTQSEEAIWCVTSLHGTAVELDREIDAFNRWSDEHANLVKGTAFGTVRLPVLEQWSCVARADTLARLAPAGALAQIDQLLSEFLEYRQPSLDTLAGMFQAAADEHGQIAENRLRQQWSELLAYAECHVVTDAELEPTLADIERRLALAERARLSAQLPFDPFLSER
jgi:hypothetical protein